MADHIDGMNAYLAHRGIKVLAVSRA